jgi:hypothetical protein
MCKKMKRDKKLRDQKIMADFATYDLSGLGALALFFDNLRNKNNKGHPSRQKQPAENPSRQKR